MLTLTRLNRVIECINRQSKWGDMVHRVRHLSGLGVSVAFIMSMSIVGCSKPVTEAECDKAYDKLIEVRTLGEPKLVSMVKRSELNAKRPQFLAACVGQVERKVLQCWHAAQTNKQLKACDRK